LCKRWSDDLRPIVLHNSSINSIWSFGWCLSTASRRPYSGITSAFSVVKGGSSKFSKR
jgi:hypothetical protein